MQNPEIAERALKNAFLFKDYTTPSGNILKYQGYEHFALKELFSIYTEEDVITGIKNVPRIWYITEDDKKHIHYPDIYIESENLLIEIKSTWTVEKKKDNIFLKQEACKKAGYNYQIWVYNQRGEKVEIFE